MKRLSAMETHQAMFPSQGVQLHPQVQPLMSPAVPHPGTQTQSFIHSFIQQHSKYIDSSGSIDHINDSLVSPVYWPVQVKVFQ